MILALVIAGAVAACSGKGFAPGTVRAGLPAGQPGKGRPPVTLGEKNFTEQFILGQIYAQALHAKGIFGFQNVAPVVSKPVLSREGPGFAQTLNAVSATLSTRAIQRMNAAVDVDHRAPAAVARRFLAGTLLR